MKNADFFCLVQIFFVILQRKIVCDVIFVHNTAGTNSVKSWNIKGVY